MAHLDIAPVATPGEPTVPSAGVLRAKLARIVGEAAALQAGLRDDASADERIGLARGLDATLAGLAQTAAVRSHIRASAPPVAPAPERK